MLTQAKIKELIYYNPLHGTFTWIYAASRNHIRVGDCAGYIDKSTGYLKIKVNGKNYQAHRIAWLYTHGEFPLNSIDHINGIKDDNRIANLRAVTHSENMKNTKMHRDNTSGHAGVFWRKDSRKWRAVIRVDGPQVSLGCFDDKSDAIKARKQAEIDYGFHKNHGRKC